MSCTTRRPSCCIGICSRRARSTCALCGTATGRWHETISSALCRTAKKFDYATLPFAEVYQLGAALAYLERVGVERIARHTVSLARELRDGLAARGFRLFTPPNNGSSIVSFYVDPQASTREI